MHQSSTMPLAWSITSARVSAMYSPERRRCATWISAITKNGKTNGDDTREPRNA